MSAGFFDSFRVYGGPTLYPPNKTAVTADVLEAGLIYAILTLAVGFFFILPGVRGKERIFTFIRVCFGLFILACIMMCNFGQEWETSEIETETQYRAGVREEVHVKVGVKIALRSVNITLKGKPVEQLNETINYNERFHWSNPWGQGRAGFGPFAGRINREYREAQFKGLPYPILWVAEYFTIDGEGIRWGRFYRQAGFYTHIMLWTAFPLWIITLILFSMVVKFGAYFMMMTGGCLLIGNALYGGIRNPTALAIPFTDQDILRFHWGWCFWLNMVAGLLCVLFGFIIWLLDECGWEEELAAFFGVDVLTSYEEIYPDATEEEAPEEATNTPSIKLNRGNPPEGAANGGYEPSGSDEEYQDMPIPAAPVPTPRQRVGLARQDTIDVKPKPMYRRRTKKIIPDRLTRKGHSRPAAPPPPTRYVSQPEDDDDDYENMAAMDGRVSPPRFRPQRSNPNDVHIEMNDRS